MLHNFLPQKDIIGDSGGTELRKIWYINCVTALLMKNQPITVTIHNQLSYCRRFHSWYENLEYSQFKIIFLLSNFYYFELNNSIVFCVKMHPRNYQ